MEQAVVDLPDKPEPSADSLAQTDELLSQMVGSDIDRMLADADAAPPQSLDVPAEQSSQAADHTALTAELDDLFNELQNGSAAPAATDQKTETAELPAEPSPAASVAPDAAPAATVAEVTTETKPEMVTEGAERAALLQAAGFEPTAPEPTPAATDPAPVAAATAAPIGESPDPVHEAAPSGSERSALLAAAGFDTNPDAPGLEVGPNPAPLPEADLADDGPLPFYLKPLEWINAPLKSRPVIVRQSLGRAAIVTLVNAMAVLAYVLIFRKH